MVAQGCLSKRPSDEKTINSCIKLFLFFAFSLDGQVAWWFVCLAVRLWIEVDGVQPPAI